jgi:hypothetical protein
MVRLIDLVPRTDDAPPGDDRGRRALVAPAPRVVPSLPLAARASRVVPSLFRDAAGTAATAGVAAVASRPARPLVPTLAAATPPPAPPIADPLGLLEAMESFLAAVPTFFGPSGFFPWTTLDNLLEDLLTALETSDELIAVVGQRELPAHVHPLAFHQARVVVFAMCLGRSLAHDRRRVIGLGMAGALIDVALWQERDAALSEEAQYLAHPERSAAQVATWAPPSLSIVAAIRDHHEREQGQGFPRRIAGADIDADAKILGLADVYAGLTGPAAGDARLTPHEAIRELARTKRGAFPPALIKALLTEMSFFPPGTLVSLSTGEIARVAHVNRTQPLRPRLDLVRDARGHRVPGSRQIDLADTPFVFVTGPLPTGTAR